MKRWMWRTLGCVFLGAVTTVAVAWSLVLSRPFSSRTSMRHMVRAEAASDGWDGLWSVWKSSQFGEVAFTSFRSDSMRETKDISIAELHNALPAWLPHRQPGPVFLDDVSQTEIWHVHAAGWPMLALWADYTGGGRASNLVWMLDVEHGIETAIDRDGRGIHEELGMPLALPTVPIVPGMLIDSLFFGGVWYALFAFVARISHAFRRKEGRCPQCKYDLRGNPEGVTGCPECGWGRAL